MKTEINEIISVLQEMNAELGEQLGYDTEIRVTLTTDGYGSNIDLLGFNLWSSEDETREYYEETNSYEPWEQCLKRVMKEKVQVFNKVVITE